MFVIGFFLGSIVTAAAAVWLAKIALPYALAKGWIR